jgi:maltose alpha-D-glucosyltransferase/alpha-amylase
VINHTSDQHPWFQEARLAPPGSSKRNFYVWSDSPEKYSAARIIFTDTETSNWTWDPVAKAYYWHRFFHHQPDLNYDNPQVLRAVFKVMRFWLDMGVDGMRLDAIPYLIEREGTNCENLPESHEIIKKFRREMDEHYSDRMLLAEANQWPADVLDYFGDADECHMAFHFPLMPRIFMALRQEDRHPIVEIMRQTPDIPPDCQWVTFLRNHDELTLEMVTDDERDYMYREYAADPRMRLNLGIRRRLAPLMGNNRRSIELMNSLLFSLVGTPVIYYGDEIGMGDNIYLGDRNGVRTPMQWTGDRNAGFSKADFARLYTPPIIDPVYGYQSISVEAQQRDASSLLNWMKRLITLRKRYQAFGRGTLEFLHPRNRKVLAYLRCYGDEIILAVANVSRFVQPFSLDLERFQGYTPVELFGGVEFPTLGESPYFLSLGPYAFMWFRLDRLKHTVDSHVSRAPALPAEELPSLKLAGGWETLMEGKSRATLERSVLPNYLLRQRWFGAKSRTLETVSIRDWVTLSGGSTPALLVFIRAYYSDGHSDKYSLPLGIAEGVAAESLLLNQPGTALAFVTGGDSAGILYDAVANDEFCERLLQMIEGSREVKTRSGAILGIKTSAYDDVQGEPAPIGRGSAEQSNSAIIYGRRFLMKLFRRLENGVNPDLEMGRFLTEKAAFPRTPKTAGALEYRRSRTEPITVALLQEYVSNQGQGWQLALDVLGRYFEDVSTLEHRLSKIETNGHSLIELCAMETPPDVFEVVGVALNTADVLGQRTAEMHLALASDPQDPAFSPEPLEKEELAEMVQTLQVQVRKTLTLLREKLETLPADVQRLAQEILDRGAGLASRFQPLTEGVGPLLKIRCHGDYHLGQVLWHENDFIILDFEGEPGRTVAQRRAKKSPLRDVAGMLRSLDYAVYSKLLSSSRDQPENYDRLEPWAKVWKNWTSASLLRGYRATAEALLPDDQSVMALLLEFFMMEKTLFEFQYELNYRPDWVRIPMLGILNLMKTGS